MKCLVTREPDSLLWVAEVPRVDTDGRMLGWHSEWFVTWRGAYTFALHGPLLEPAIARQVSVDTESMTGPGSV